MSADHPDINNARLGIANPGVGNVTPEQHQGGNFKCNFTSWSMAIGVANFMPV